MSCDCFMCTLDGICTKPFCVYKSTKGEWKICEYLRVFSKEDADEVLGTNHVD